MPTPPLSRELVRFRAAVTSAGARAAPVPESPRLHRLGARLGLDAGAQAFVWACVAAAADPALHPHLVALGGADARRGLAPATWAALVGASDDEAIALARWLDGAPPLVRAGLIAPALDGLVVAATPFAASARLVAHLAGDDALDPALRRLAARVEPPATRRLDARQAAAGARLDDHVAAGDCLVIVSGPAGAGRRAAIAAAAARAGRRAIALDAARIDPAAVDAVVRALVREALLDDAVPIVAGVDALLDGPDGARHARAVARALDDAPGACAVTCRDQRIELASARPVRRVEWPAPDAPTRAALWSDAISATTGAAPAAAAVEALALRYALGPGGIGAAVAATPAPITPEALAAGVRHELADRFGGLAERLDVSGTWDDVVLGADTREQLDTLLARVHHAYRVFEQWRFPRDTARGGGVAALFSGPPGTGKTLVAGLVARALDRDIYRVDLSQIVSKWVGETEKQLARVFDAAEAGHALLLFDEADALFARRTEVKSSSDKYANLEVNYLLQRIESFGGVTILTTNLDGSIDPALRRRLAAHVVFWPPEHDERVALWRRFLTTGAPVAGDVDVDALAEEYADMTGANIRNAALAATFAAAAGGGEVTQAGLERAARAEHRAMGRMLGGKG